DLKTTLEKAVASFNTREGRQRVIVFLGNGMSIHNPIDNKARVGLCEEMIKKDVAFFPVPLGNHLDPTNLHGLTTGTGGLLVRLMPNEDLKATVKRLTEAVAAPILYPSKFELSKTVVAEMYPNRLPPLRGDAPTLVVGKLKAAEKLSYTIEG